MWDIWAKLLLLKGLKSCPKSNKSPNLVTLIVINKKLNRFSCKNEPLPTTNLGNLSYFFCKSIDDLKLNK